MNDQLVTRLLPILAKPPEEEFNIFNVMHHGTHEKQLSNVFAWLLDANGTHRLGDAFQQIFVTEVSGALGDQPVPQGTYSVRQEVNTNTSDPAEGMDIADIVLKSDNAVLVVENYYTSCGHGHRFENYRAFGARGGKTSIVVMLCEMVNSDELADGWERAAVVTYSKLVGSLLNHIEGSDDYNRDFPQQCAFFHHMHRYFVKGRRVSDDELINFVGVMCASGEAGRFGTQPVEAAEINFGDMLREQAIERFAGSRELLQRVKSKLKKYGAQFLKAQVNAALGSEYIAAPRSNWAGIHQWSVNFPLASDESEPDPAVQLKFGPSAWYANEKGKTWKSTASGANADYSRLFLKNAKTKEVRQSTVSLHEVLDGLSGDDFRLRDEIVLLIREGDFGPKLNEV